MDVKAGAMGESNRDDALSAMGEGASPQEGNVESTGQGVGVGPEGDAPAERYFADENASHNKLSSVPPEGVEAADGDLHALEVELVLRGNEAMVFGDDVAIREFMKSLAIPEEEGMQLRTGSSGRLRDQMKGVGAATQGLAEALEKSGYYIKLTKESFDLSKKHGLYETSGGVTYAKVVNFEKPGKPGKWLKVDNNRASLVANPALISGIGGMIAQAGVEHALSEISNYLERIDVKLDEVSGKIDDSNISLLVGVHAAIQKEIRRRDSGIEVDQMMWSKISSYGSTLSASQDNALRQIDSISNRLASCSKISDADVALGAAKREFQNWLMVLVYVRQAELWLSELELEYYFNERPANYGKYLDNVLTEQAESLAKANRGLNDFLGCVDDLVEFANSRMVIERSRSESAISKAQWIQDRIWSLQAIFGGDLKRNPIKPRELRRGEVALSRVAPLGDLLKKVGVSVAENAPDAILQMALNRLGR